MVLPLRLFFALAAGIATVVAQSERTQITVLSTTDLHGHIHPVDYYTRESTADGLAKVGTLIRRARAIDRELLLIDCGDTIQGTPLAFHHAQIANGPPDPMMLAMNALGFNALAIGNHEYNFGLNVFNKARREARFPWLSANICLEGTRDPAYTPYLIKDIRGVRVGVIGLTTPGIPHWETREHYAGLDFVDPIAAAREWVGELRRRARADVVVIAMHMGIEQNLATGELSRGQVPGENAAIAIAENVPGIDLILMGHTHRDVPSISVNNVLLTQAGRWGSHLASASLYLERDEPSSPWQVVAKTAITHDVTAETPPDPEVIALTQAYHDETESWLDQTIGELDHPLSAAESRERDTAIIDLINRVQLDAGNAEVSLAASFNPAARLPEGELTIRDFAGLYVYPNTLVVVELSGGQIKEALEHSALYFGRALPGRSIADHVDPSIPGYNFDMAEGVDYEIDLSREPGDRIINLSFNDAPIDLERTFRVAINNYRHNGGGGYAMYPDAPVISRSNVGIRELIIDWVRTHPDEVPAAPNENWRIRVP